MRYFKKEIITAPLYLGNGRKVAFESATGNAGVMACDDEYTCNQLEIAAKLRRGGVTEIGEPAYNALLDGSKPPTESKSMEIQWKGVMEYDHESLIKPQSFYHSGDTGDVIYALPTIRAMGGGRLRLGPENRTQMKTRLTMNQDIAANIAPLAAAQPYIESVEWAERIEDGDLDMNAFRTHLARTRLDVAPGMNLARLQFLQFGLPMESDQQAWLTIDNPIEIDGRDVVFARSPRYQNPRFNWREVVRRLKDRAVFVGTKNEWEQFGRLFGELPRYECADLLVMARVIAGARLFVGNQSCPYAIAEGLKQNAILEVCLGIANCLFPRPNVWAVANTPFRLPDINTLERIQTHHHEPAI